MGGRGGGGAPEVIDAVDDRSDRVARRCRSGGVGTSWGASAKQTGGHWWCIIFLLLYLHCWDMHLTDRTYDLTDDSDEGDVPDGRSNGAISEVNKRIDAHRTARADSAAVANRQVGNDRTCLAGGSKDHPWRCAAWEARCVGGRRLPGPRPARARIRDRAHRRQLIVRPRRATRRVSGGQVGDGEVGSRGARHRSHNGGRESPSVCNTCRAPSGRGGSLALVILLSLVVGAGHPDARIGAPPSNAWLREHHDTPVLSSIYLPTALPLDTAANMTDQWNDLGTRGPLVAHVNSGCSMRSNGASSLVPRASGPAHAGRNGTALWQQPRPAEVASRQRLAVIEAHFVGDLRPPRWTTEHLDCARGPETARTRLEEDSFNRNRHQMHNGLFYARADHGTTTLDLDDATFHGPDYPERQPYPPDSPSLVGRGVHAVWSAPRRPPWRCDEEARRALGVGCSNISDGSDQGTRPMGPQACAAWAEADGPAGWWAARWQPWSRIGEASNPGPAAVGPPELPDLATTRRIHDGAMIIDYPRPSQKGLSNFIAPGFVGSGRDTKGGDDEFRLVVETVNATGWTALKKRLAATDAHAVLAQETWVTQAGVAAASAWARRHGWKSVWSPAVTTDKGGTSAGVAVFARAFLGLHYPSGGPHEICASRAVAAILEIPGQRPILVASCYLVQGIGAAEENKTILAKVGAACKGCGDDMVCITGGDHNMEPAEIVGTGFDREADLTLFYADSERGTYRAARARSTLDYFFVSDRMAPAVEKVRLIEASGVRGHVPVQLQFKSRLAALKALYLRPPPKLPVERVIGPLPAAPDWSSQAQLANAALAAVRAGADASAVDNMLEVAYAEWANLAEHELQDYTGTYLKKLGERANKPKLVWRSVLPERKYQKVFPRAAAATWMHGIAGEAARIVSVAKAAGQRVRVASLHAAEDPSDYDDQQFLHAADDIDDVDPAADADGSEGQARNTAESRRRRPPDAQAQCHITLQEMRRSLDDDRPDGDPDTDVAEAWQKLLDIVDLLITATRADQRQDGDGAPMQMGRSSEPQWHPPAAEAVGLLADVVATVREELGELASAATSEERAHEERQWREWLTEDFQAGASRAHAFSRLPQEAVPVAARTEGGALSSAPEELLDEQRRKYRALWHPAQGAFAYDWQSRTELPPLAVQRLREIAMSFTRRTAQTFDGFHPRLLGALSDDALGTLATLLLACETAGRWPRQINLVVTALIPKPKGGFRPIGVLPAVYRLWAKARRDLTDPWEAQYSRAYLASAKGNGPTDTLWRMGVRQEVGAAEGNEAGIIAEDLAAFFETVDRRTLMREAAALNFPASVLRGALAMYSAARMVTLQGRVSREIYPTVGVVAGCSLAMSLTKLLYLRVLDAYVEKLPPTVSLDVYVDDMTLSAIGPPCRVADDLVKARGDLEGAIEGLGCRFAEGKTAITASTRRLAGTIARRIGAPDAVSSATCLLGIDNTAGAQRAKLNFNSKKAARLRAAMARQKRLKSLRKTLGARAGRIFRAGLLPAATYDAPIWGIADAEVTKLRRLAATTMSPRAPGRSLSMTLLWHGVPTADAEHAPILQYAKMTWKAATRREEARMRGGSITDLRRAWEAARVGFDPLVERLLNARGPDGKIPRAVARGAWRNVRGPIAAAAVTMARVGWRFTAPFVVQDADGVDYCLTTTSPMLLRDLLRGALRTTLEKGIGATLADSDPALRGRRACLDLAIAASKASRKINPRQAAAFRAVACGAVWTGSVARQRGYDTDGWCALCRQALDTIHHRTYCCPCTAHAVRAAVPRWFWDEAMRATPTNLFWTRGVFPHPADVAPLPRADLRCEVEVHEAGEKYEFSAPGSPAFAGKAYMDGSCIPSPIRGLARAACALVAVGTDGRPLKTLQLPVPRGLPQTSQSAEHLIVAVAFDCLRGAGELVGDCLSVVRSFSADLRRALAPTRKYAGLIAETLKDPRKRRDTSIRWTKAHRTLRGSETAEETADIVGNAAADAAAGEAIALHPALGPDVEAAVLFHTKRIPHVVAAVAAAMECFPPAPRNMTRLPRPATLDEARGKERHFWRWAAGAWRCQACDDYITTPSVPEYRLHQRCSGTSMADMAGNHAGQGHKMIKVESELPFVMCSHCGAWGNRRTRKLGQPCGEPSPAGAQAIKRVLSNQHPLLSRGGRGAPTRARVTIIASYDASNARWVAFDARHASDGQASAEQVDAHPEPACADEAMEMDPQDMDGACSEEDVFGHGGSLDAAGGDARPMQMRPASASPAIEPGNGGPRGGEPAMEIAPAPNASRRRQRAHTGSPTRNFAAEAIERLGQTLRRRDTDAAGRLDRLRRRILDRSVGPQPVEDARCTAASATSLATAEDEARGRKRKTCSPPNDADHRARTTGESPHCGERGRAPARHPRRQHPVAAQDKDALRGTKRTFDAFPQDEPGTPRLPPPRRGHCLQDDLAFAEGGHYSAPSARVHNDGEGNQELAPVDADDGSASSVEDEATPPHRIDRPTAQAGNHNTEHPHAAHGCAGGGGLERPVPVGMPEDRGRGKQTDRASDEGAARDEPESEGMDSPNQRTCDSQPRPAHPRPCEDQGCHRLEPADHPRDHHSLIQPVGRGGSHWRCPRVHGGASGGPLADTHSPRQGGAHCESGNSRKSQDVRSAPVGDSLNHGSSGIGGANAPAQPQRGGLSRSCSGGRASRPLGARRSRGPDGLGQCLGAREDEGDPTCKKQRCQQPHQPQHRGVPPLRSRAELVARLRHGHSAASGSRSHADASGAAAAPHGPAAATVDSPPMYSAATDARTAASGIREALSTEDAASRATARSCTARHGPANQPVTKYSAAAAATAAACDGPQNSSQDFTSHGDPHTVPRSVPAVVGECGRSRTYTVDAAVSSTRRRLRGKQTPRGAAAATRAECSTAASPSTVAAQPAQPADSSDQRRHALTGRPPD